MKRPIMVAVALAVVAFAAEPPAFEVASIKPTQHGRNAEGWSFSDVKIPSPGRLAGINASIDEIIRWAYELKDYQLFGPDWLKSDTACFDIEAKAPPATNPQEMKLMTQALLSDRFRLKLHRETRILPVYDLVVAKNGPRLQPGRGGSAGFSSRGGRDGVRVTSDSGTIAGLADRLSRDLERPVFDKTNIKGSFKVVLEWAREGDGPSVFSAVQEQLGLKLDPTREPIEVVVIDHVEKMPTEN